jgi:hypothetical protein
MYKMHAKSFFSGLMSIRWAVRAPSGAVQTLANEMMSKPGKGPLLNNLSTSKKLHQ